MASSLRESWDSEENCAMRQIFIQRILWREIITSSSVAIKSDLIHSRSIKVAEDAVCVCLCDWDKVCPQESILFFYWLLQGKKGRRPWRISFQDSLSPKRAGGGKKRWHANILKSCTNFTSFQSRLCLHIGRMPWRNVNSLTITQKTEKKKEERNGDGTIWWSGQNSEASSSSFTVESVISLHMLKTTHQCLISCQHITSTTQGCNIQRGLLLRANDFSMFVSTVSPARVPRVNPPLMRLIFPESGSVSTGPMH